MAQQNTSCEPWHRDQGSDASIENTSGIDTDSKNDNVTGLRVTDGVISSAHGPADRSSTGLNSTGAVVSATGSTCTDGSCLVSNEHLVLTDLFRISDALEKDTTQLDQVKHLHVVNLESDPHNTQRRIRSGILKQLSKDPNFLPQLETVVCHIGGALVGASSDPSPSLDKGGASTNWWEVDNLIRLRPKLDLHHVVTPSSEDELEYDLLPPQTLTGPLSSLCTQYKVASGDRSIRLFNCTAMPSDEETRKQQITQLFSLYLGRPALGPPGACTVRWVPRIAQCEVERQMTEDEERATEVLFEGIAQAGWVPSALNGYPVIEKVQGFDPRQPAYEPYRCTSKTHNPFNDKA